jgi:hypothetical protein
MRHPLFLLLLACAAARGGDLRLAKPSDDWDILSPGAKQPTLKAHLRSDFDGGRADLYLYVFETKTALADYVAQWAADLGKRLDAEPALRDGKLGGAPCRVVDVRNEAGHVTSWLVRRGGAVITLHAVRSGDAVGDEDVEAEIARVRDGLRLPEPPSSPKPPADKQEEPKPAEPSPRAGIELPFWRLEVVKPRGFERAAKLDASESANGVVVKLTAERERSRCWIRVYAHTNARKERGEKVLERRRAHVLALYEGKQHEERELPKWKPPLTKKEHRFGLVGKRSVAESWRWYVLECRNGRQYEVEIYTTGAWDAEIKDFLDHFRPIRGR